MLKSPCMFEDECLFYTLANFYREQGNLKGIFFELKCSYPPVSERESAAFVFIPEPTARSAVPGVSPGRGLLIPLLHLRTSG